MVEENKIRDAADAVKGIVEAVPVYEDLAQPAARELGNTLGTITGLINIALAPLEKHVWRYRKIREELNSSLSEKLKDVPEEHIKTPPINVAGPTIEALRFASEEPDLRELYSNLLATAMDDRTAKEAHPSFVEIIKQLSPDEARIINLMSNRLQHNGNIGYYPVISLYAKESETGHQIDVIRQFSLLGEESGCMYPDMTSNYLDNLCRLGLTKIALGRHLVDSNVYKPLEEHPTILRLKTEVQTSKDHKADIKRTFINLSDLGIQFCRACVIPHEANKIIEV